MPAAQDSAVGALRGDRKLAFRCAPGPDALPGLVKHNLTVAVELLLRLLPSPKARHRAGVGLSTSLNLPSKQGSLMIGAGSVLR